jgi:YbgC/YbaW family acyl-CoA thioester hydrolase
MKTEIDRRIMNYQTDSFGIVHHARYLELMEEARLSYFYENDLVEWLHQKGIFHVIVNININYMDSARFGDLITIKTEVFRVTEKSVIFRQTVFRDESILVIAEITNVFMNKADHGTITVVDMAEFWEDVEKLQMLRSKNSFSLVASNMGKGNE